MLYGINMTNYVSSKLSFAVLTAYRHFVATASESDNMALISSKYGQFFLLFFSLLLSCCRKNGYYQIYKYTFFFKKKKRNISLINEIGGEPQTHKGDYKIVRQLLTKKDKI